MPEQLLDENQAPQLDGKTPVSNLPGEQAVLDASGIVSQGAGAAMKNPMEGPDEPVTPEEQAEYDDAFKRVMAMVHDTREQGGKKSMADSLIKQMTNTGGPAYESIGKAAGNAMKLFHENAKRQGKEYSGDVLREVGMDLVTELMDVAGELGAVKVPEDGTPEGDEFYKLAVLEAAKLFGDYYLKTGQADVEGEKQGMQEQMEREGQSGELDDWDMQGMDPNAMKEMMAQKQGIA